MTNKKYKELEELIAENEIEYLDLRFTDLNGLWHHVTFPINVVEPSLFEDGKMFDGSSIPGWRGINQSDMVLLPDPTTALLDPYMADPTLIMICDVLDPLTMQAYDRDPRSIAKRAESYLQSTGIADTAFFGPEPEFFIFDNVSFTNTMQKTGFEVNSDEGHWASDDAYGRGYTNPVKGGYFPVPPRDQLHDMRAAMCQDLTAAGQVVEVHHHEVAGAGQCEIGVRFNTLVQKADELQMFKYIVKNVAYESGKTATFMPKPIVGDNGSGMHVHQSLAADGKNLFSGDGYGGLSQMALWYIGGVFKHARAINAFANATTNSYKRLVPGFEAPVMLAYSASNRSASCRIPFVANPKGRRIEFRFPDAMNSGYLTFAALMMAGLDGIKNKIDPGEASDKDLYDLPPEEAKNIPTVCASLDEALSALDNDREFLTAGGVFSDDLIDAYISLKMRDVTRYRAATHPLEYEMYYSL